MLEATLPTKRSAALAVRGAGLAAFDERCIPPPHRAQTARRRVLLTEDKDFGQLAYATGHSTAGVVLIRYPAQARGTLGAAVVAVVAELGDRLIGAFVVVEPGRARLGRLA